MGADRGTVNLSSGLLGECERQSSEGDKAVKLKPHHLRTDMIYLSETNKPKRAAGFALTHKLTHEDRFYANES